MEQMLSKLIELQCARPSVPVQSPPSMDGCQLPADFPLLDNASGDFSSVQDTLHATYIGLLDAPSVSMPDSNADVAKQTLVSLFPAQEDVDIITSETMAWVFRLPDPPGTMLKADDETPSLNLATIMGLPAVGIGRALLYLALDIQQLPPDFDTSKLQVLKCDSAVSVYTHHISSLVLADEEVACTVEGLQCLLLLAMIYINDGDIRKAWMSFRRAVDIAKVQGYHSSYSRARRDVASEEAIMQRRLWLSCVMGDSYTSLLLGLESGAGREPFGSDPGWKDPMADADSNFERQLAILSSRLFHCGLSRDHDLQEDIVSRMDDDLDHLEMSMPESWWRTPLPTREKSMENAQAYNRLVCQQWFLQLRMLTHLRGMLSGSSGHADWEHSRSSCLEAARITVQGYLPLRQSGVSLMHCRALDIALFVASVVMILGTALASDGKPPRRAQNSDSVMIQQVIRILEADGEKSRREHIFRQSARVLKLLIAACEEKADGNLRQLTPPATTTPSSSSSRAASDHIEGASESRAAGGRSAALPAAGRQGGSKLHEILSSCFQNILGAGHPASRLIDSAFSPPVPMATGTSPAEPQEVDFTSLDAFLDMDNIIDWEL